MKITMVKVGIVLGGQKFLMDHEKLIVLFNSYSENGLSIQMIFQNIQPIIRFPMMLMMICLLSLLVKRNQKKEKVAKTVPHHQKVHKIHKI